MSQKKTYSITEYEKHLNYICDKICTLGQINNDLDTIVASEDLRTHYDSVITTLARNGVTEITTETDEES